MSEPLALWGGHECTVNRIGAVWRDQTLLSGHEHRIDDLDLFASLGLKAIRYPLLWERTEVSPGEYDWRWADARLGRLRELGIRPIVGLLHHGSGPNWTSLLSPNFATGLAAFAAAAAARYPWVQDWTPVNEPLTTARFSALYGHWYPHMQDEGAFWHALVNQIEAVRASMLAIRQVNPAARLVQTEDWGRTFSTGPCAEQAAHESERRFMTWDLLCGQVRPDHTLRARLDGFDLGARLDALVDQPCPPDVLGFNHYVTSDRFLDHRLEAYPAHLHGGNGRLSYADVDAVRVAEVLPCGWAAGLRALWERYRIPIAVTECHLGGEIEDQIHWLQGCWRSALAARAEGVEVEAVTVWSLLGSHDWNSLLTRWDGHYEAGAFDVSSGSPVETPLTAEIRRHASPEHLHVSRQGHGWWRDPKRLAYPPWRPTRRGSRTPAPSFHPSLAEPDPQIAGRRPVS